MLQALPGFVQHIRYVDMSIIKHSERFVLISIANGEFEVDENGYIWRLKRRNGKRYGGTAISLCTRKRAENQTGTGHLQVRVSIDGVRHHALAHRVVWSHLNGEIPEGMVINHINGTKNDNRPINLECVSKSENVRHSFEVLDRQPLRGSSNGSAKLSENDVRRIRELKAAGLTQSEIAETYGISFQQVSRIINGSRWSHLI
ncbi:MULTISPECIES: HNH endonuclease [Planktothrix]|uniref:HTH cro/C1-type domain-containing protein n=1 Tax=Planktothrix rubescens CCAP 1459/22 TaxID=329571 RepID=A0A6J7ZE78_PLARU|nr:MULTISPECIES: HNH endonuclease [Planktothrix]MCB8784644.1 HNH endonuclease [Planktothrix agardhii 1808]MCB8766491.1 HNH endonuclease [Planktothrix agardhii 1809]MCB8780304.1 HNH endonuclease [Planktothrix agardhii 1031]MCF3568969.1 HNH endonuclease [Planktothrix agardhii 1807]MCF3592338.1 HNH endonuclease [Planktothrix agardhii 1029]